MFQKVIIGIKFQLYLDLIKKHCVLISNFLYILCPIGAFEGS